MAARCKGHLEAVNSSSLVEKIVLADVLEKSRFAAMAGKDGPTFSVGLLDFLP